MPANHIIKPAPNRIGKPAWSAAVVPWSRAPIGMETCLHHHSLVVERKHVTFDLRENSRGRFLRITEEVCGRRNSIIVPLTGIDSFRDALNEVIQFSKTLSLEA
jgi:hypothetical protein